MVFKKQSAKNHNPEVRENALITSLAEGYYYPFKITNIIALPDGTEAFVLIDINGVKHLLEKGPYDPYHFKVDQTIRCRIDKINCTGRIYIEPEHPVYKPGGRHQFEFVEYREAGNDNYFDQKAAVFRDSFGKDILVPENEINIKLTRGQYKEALVEKIKKGRVYISFNQTLNDYCGLKHNENYSFTLNGTITAGGGYAFYVLTDESGNEFRIRKKYYRKYGFRNGDKLICKYIRKKDEAYLEPVHPHYKPGHTYPFRIIGSTTIVEYPDKKVKAFLLENKYGKDIVVRDDQSLEKHKKGFHIDCRVIEIVKSQIFLNCGKH